MSDSPTQSEQRSEIYVGPQPEVNIGTLGHVDNGKSTLVQALTGVWTSRHSEELRRGITIRIGYADAAFYKCEKCKAPSCYTNKNQCLEHGSQAKLLRAVSFVDCPGHHSLMVTMLSGASLMDGALFVVASDTKCPQAQDREHLLAADIAGLNNIVIVQNKIDIVDQKRAMESYKEIKQFVKKTVAEDAPIVPVSAQHGTNIDVLIEAMEKHILTPKRDSTAPVRMPILRSFDVNKPGTEPEQLAGGVIGGSISQGTLRVGDEIEISPGIRIETSGKTSYEKIQTSVMSLRAGGTSVKEAKSGGLVAVATDLDPSLAKSDSFVGNMAGNPGTLPEVAEKLTLEAHLFERVVGIEGMSHVDKIKTKEPLVLNVATAVTSGVVSSARTDIVEIDLRKPICVDPSSKIAISRRIGEGWRLIGHGTMK